MSQKQMLFEQMGYKHISEGIEKLAHAVGVTLGPGGRNVLLERQYAASHMTKDGVTVAKDIELEEPFENMGAKLIAEAAKKTNREVGDGTTTSVVLTRAMIRAGAKYQQAGVSPVALREGIEKGVAKAVDFLEEFAIPVKGKKAIEHVGLLASNGDQQLGELFADAITQTGPNGVVKVEENDGVDTYLEFVDGMEFDKGYLSPYFINDAQERRVVFEDPYLLITDHKLSSIRDLVPVLEKVAPQGKPLLIIAEDVEGEALAGLILNRLRGVLNVAAIKAPGFGDRRKAMLEDLATFTGGTFLSKDLGFDWDSVTVSQLGRCKKLEVDKDWTQFFRGAGKKSDVDQRLQQIEAQIGQTTSTYDREKLEERRAKLSGKVAIVRVGAHTEVELKERKDRAEDALNATKAAAAEGIVPGSGTAYVRAISAVESVSAPGDEKFGVNVVLEALRAPLEQLGSNAGFDGPALVAEVEELEGYEGYDLETEKVVDLMKVGIVDALRVVRVALQNAASVATLTLISDTLVTEVPTGAEPVEGAVV